jgi:hypothetical protein
VSAGVRGFRPVVGALTLGAALLLALSACGGGKGSPSTTAAASTSAKTTTSTLPTSLPSTPAATPTTCSAWGKAFAATFNKTAKKQQNPERMLDVCCAAQNTAGVSHCVLTLTLAGTTSKGCEVVNLNNAGSPVSVGRRVKCTETA